MSHAVCLLVGVFVGAWLTYRANAGQSPIPSVSEFVPEKPEPTPPPREGIRV
jgi:hypothetical protein